MSRPYQQPQFSKMALAPGILATIALGIGLALIGTELFTVVLYAVSILAIIVAVFAVQARSFWWLIGLAPIAVLWNPVWPIALPEDPWRFLQIAAIGVFMAAGLRIKVPVDAAASAAVRRRP